MSTEPPSRTPDPRSPGSAEYATPDADPADSYIVPAVVRLVCSARNGTPYGLLARRWLPSRYGNWRFVDTWVLSHLAFSIVVWLLLPLMGGSWAYAVLLAYGAWRIWEVCVTALDVMLGGRPDAEFTVRSLRRSLILGVLNYLEVIFWFAAFYGHFAEGFAPSLFPLVATLTGSFYFSILTMATYGDIAPQSTFGRWLVASHLLISIFLTIGVLGRLVSALPRPRPRDRTED